MPKYILHGCGGGEPRELTSADLAEISVEPGQVITWQKDDGASVVVPTPRTFPVPADGAAIHPDAVDQAFFPMMMGDDAFSPPYENRDGVGIVRVRGPLTQHKDFFFESYEGVEKKFRAALADENVRSVVLDISSPGGSVGGLFNFTDSMRAAKRMAKKPVLAYAHDTAFSAAYAIATVADSINMPESGGVGSVGVLSPLVDRSKRNEKEGLKVEIIRSGAQKALGHPDEPISDESRKAAQARVNGLAEMFAHRVAEARGLKPQDVLALEGASLYGASAIRAGLADNLCSFDACIDAAKKAAQVTRQHHGEKPMSLAAMIAAVLGATASATEAELLDTARIMATFQRDAFALLGVDSPADALGMVRTLKKDAERAVALGVELENIKTEARHAAVRTQVEDAIRAGKLPPADRAFAVELGIDSPKAFDKFMGSRTKVVELVATEPVKPAATTAETGDPQLSAVVLTPEDRQIAAMFGRTEEQALEDKKAYIVEARRLRAANAD